MLSAEMFLLAMVLIVVAVSVIAPRVGVAAPILLVIAGIAGGLIPGVPHVEIPPELILTVVLPPILYAAAVNLPAIDFRRDFSAISALSVGLVLVTAFGSGLLIYLLFPGLGLAAAIAVGAVIAPPDAVAATAICKRLGLPRRLVTVLEGEGLVNDATALVLLRSALAATAGAFSFWGAVADFGYAIAVAVVIGAVVGVVAVRLRAKLRQPQLSTVVSFVVAFAAFIAAEELGASGVLSVVVAGLVTGHSGIKRLTPQDRLTERINWRTISLLLENGVFFIMGFQLPAIVDDVRTAGLGVWHAVWIALLTTVVLMVTRAMFIVPLIAVLKRRARSRASEIAELESAIEQLDAAQHTGPHHQRLRHMLRRRHADSSFYASEGIGWKGGAILAWSGMRGVVTLAAAQTLPSDMEYRSQLILIAFTVAIVTIIGQGGTLPLVIRLLGIQGTPQEEAQRELAQLMAQLGEAGASALESPDLRRSDGQPFADEVVEQARLINARLMDATARRAASDDAERQRSELVRLVGDAQQAALLDARSAGQYSSHTIERAQQILDASAIRTLGS